MDLQEKLNEVNLQIEASEKLIQLNKDRLKTMKSLQKQYLKLIEKAKALDK